MFTFSVLALCFLMVILAGLLIDRRYLRRYSCAHSHSYVLTLNTNDDDMSSLAQPSPFRFVPSVTSDTAEWSWRNE